MYLAPTGRFADTRAVLPLFSWYGAMLLAAALGGSLPAEEPSGGLAPYTPTRGEWLCLSLNVEQALADSEQIATSPVQVRFAYDRAQPDTIQIRLIVGPGATLPELQRRAAGAEQLARQVAQLRGWDSWMNLERKEIRISEAPAPGPNEQ